MGESSACLVRSFSVHSPTSGEEKKRNSLHRALTTSISFGRFTSESLDWEKWSAFTHNRYMEEVEKFSKPGSVAEKKAYFEAHYKRRRAAVLEQENATDSSSSETNKKENNSSLDVELVTNDCNAVTEEMKEGEVQNSMPVFPVGSNGGNTAPDENEFGGAQPGEAEQAIKQPFVIEVSEALANQLENDGCLGDIRSSQEDKTCSKDSSPNKNSASSSKTRTEISSSELSTNGGASKLAPPSRQIIPVQSRNFDNRTPKSKNTALSNKRRSNAASLHLSVNFDSCAGETQKASSPGLQKISSSKFIRTLAKTSKNSMLPQTSSRASVNGVFKQLSVPSQPEKRRTITLHGDSISGSRKVDGKVQSPGSNYSKFSSTFGNKAQSPTVSSSFTFKSEERATKRKEFFQNVEQKLQSKESDKDQLHAKSQVKARSYFMDPWHSIALKATPNAKVSHFVESPSYLSKKKSTATPGSPKVQGKLVKVQDTEYSRPPWRFSTNTDSLKGFTGKHNRPPVYPAKSKRNACENASPNIQL